RAERPARYRTQQASSLCSPEARFSPCTDDVTGAGESRLRNDELNDWSASDETFARWFAEYLARKRSGASATWRNCADRRECDLPTVPRHSKRICFYQLGRRDRRLKCDCRSQLFRTV